MAKGVLVITQLRDGRLDRPSRETVSAGIRLASELGGAVSALVLGDHVEEAAAELAGRDLEAVWTAEHEALGTYTPEAFVEATAAALRAIEPAIVVAPHTYQSVDYVPRLAHRLDAALVPEITGFSVSEGLRWQRPVFGGKLTSQVTVEGDGPIVVTVQSGAFGAEVPGGTAQRHAVDLSGVELDRRREVLGVEEAAEEAVDLSQASVIVAVGRGIGGEDKLGPIRELASALGAEIGASRPVIDSGWLPRDRQIGSSGHTVAPKLYLALGISGAIQHLVGMKAAQTIVAVNKDPGAPIFAIADYGIVGDLHEVVPALVAALAEASTDS